MTAALPRGEDRRLAASAGACALLVFVVVASSAWLRLASPGLPCPPGGCEGLTLADAVRLAHRVAAMGVSVLALLIAALAWRPPASTARRTTAITIVVLVAILAVVGRQSSGSVHPAITLTNLLGGLVLLALTAGLRAAVRAQGARAPWPMLAAALLLAGAIVAGALASAWSVAADSPLGLTHRALSWAALAGWVVLAARARRHAHGQAASLLTAASLAALAAIAVGEPAWPMARWMHNVLTAVALVAATYACAGTSGERFQRHVAPREAPAGP